MKIRRLKKKDFKKTKRISEERIYKTKTEDQVKKRNLKRVNLLET